MYCEADTEKMGSQVPIQKIENLGLRVVLYLIGRITGSTALHQASHAQMHCAVQCLQPVIFDWSTTMLNYMKIQLTECKLRKKKNFGFRTVLCAFFFERVSGLSPKESIRGHIATYPTLCRWVSLMPLQGAGGVRESYDDEFFDWWRRQIPTIEDYPYAGISFLRDPDMPMPPGAARGEIGTYSYIYFFIYF
jgi:hypothetical protein